MHYSSRLPVTLLLCLVAYQYQRPAGLWLQILLHRRHWRLRQWQQLLLHPNLLCPNLHRNVKVHKFNKRQIPLARLQRAQALPV